MNILMYHHEQSILSNTLETRLRCITLIWRIRIDTIVREYKISLTEKMYLLPFLFSLLLLRVM